MKRVRTEQRIGRPTNHFNRLSLLCVDFYELIGIAKAGRPGRDPVLEDQKAAAGTGSAKHGRTYGSLMILAAAADYPGSGNAA